MGFSAWSACYLGSSRYSDGTPIQNGLRELIAVAPGIPFGLTFLGEKWSEETLIELAAAYERVNNFRHIYVLGPNANVPSIDISDIIAKKTSSTGISNITTSTANQTRTIRITLQLNIFNILIAVVAILLL
jgi:amidase